MTGETSDSGDEDGIQMTRHSDNNQREGSKGSVDLQGVDLTVEDLDEVGAARMGPLVVSFSNEEREEAIEMMRGFLDYWKGRDKRIKQDWYNAIMFNLLAVLVMFFLLYLTYTNYVAPVLDLHTWDEVSNCRIETAKLDFVVDVKGLYTLPILEISYPQASSALQRITGFATGTVTGTASSINSFSVQDDYAGYTNCWVNPSNPYRVALTIDERIAVPVYVMISILVLITLLQTAALIQTIRTRQIRYCICSRERSHRAQGYGVVR